MIGTPHFSRPRAGFAGLSVAQAKAKRIDAMKAKIPMSVGAKATGRIIGVHCLVDHTDTLIGIGVMMVQAR
jgi:dihydrolipoamide dehydrogenase